MFRFLKFGTKVGIVGGSVYYTSKIGIWNDSSKTEEVYRDIYNFVAPYVNDIPLEMPEIPRAMDITRTIQTSWNHGVVMVAEFLTEVPDNAVSLSKTLYATVQSSLTSPGVQEK